jgi:hypothetical protein
MVHSPVSAIRGLSAATEDKQNVSSVIRRASARSATVRFTMVESASRSPKIMSQINGPPIETGRTMLILRTVISASKLDQLSRHNASQRERLTSSASGDVAEPEMQN